MKAAWMMFSTRMFTSCYNMEELNENNTCSILLCLQVKLYSLLAVVYFDVINFTLPVQDMKVKGINQNAQGYKGGSRISQTGGGGGRPTPKSMRRKHIIWSNLKKPSPEFLLKQKKNPSTFFHRHTTCIWLIFCSSPRRNYCRTAKKYTQQAFTAPQIKTLHSLFFSQGMFSSMWISSIRDMRYHTMLCHVGSLPSNLL